MLLGEKKNHIYKRVFIPIYFFIIKFSQVNTTAPTTTASTMTIIIIIIIIIIKNRNEYLQIYHIKMILYSRLFKYFACALSMSHDRIVPHNHHIYTYTYIYVRYR